MAITPTPRTQMLIASAKESLSPEHLMEASADAEALAAEYLRILREDIPGDYFFGSALVIHSTKDALLAVARLALDTPSPLEAEFRAELKTQGLPAYASLADLIRHHRGNAGAAAALEGYAGGLSHAKHVAAQGEGEARP